MSSTCVFCDVPRERIVRTSGNAVVIYDRYPVSPGHSLIIPRRHIASLFEARTHEMNELLGLLKAQKQLLDNDLSPAGYNIGVNDGIAAGQTVMHLHIHLIPRYAGDDPDPRGGVRWVLRRRAAYRSQDNP
jgi:diadenosine tetraphosphate (Ap4A) HIT family hydrolase